MQIAIVGDFQSKSETHRATEMACRHAAASLSEPVVVRWVATRELASGAGLRLEDADGVWIAPGSPYESMEGALEAIRIARTTGRPLLGTCAGFQHVILEFARNVLGIADAQHAEYDPDASELLITALSCSLAGKTMSLDLVPGTRAGDAYGVGSATERYYCNFGLNPEYLPALVTEGLTVSGVDQDDEVRIVELREHPYFLATLFVPQVASTPSHPHPLVRAFVLAALKAQIHAGIANLHDAFLNASLQHDRMKNSPVESDPRIFDASDRIRFERSWLCFLAVLVEAWQADANEPIRRFLDSEIGIGGLTARLAEGGDNGALAALVEARHYMAHRDRRRYWNKGRWAYMPHIDYFWDLHREFGRLTLLAMQHLNDTDPEADHPQ